MKKYVPYIIIAVIILGGGVAFLLLQNKGSKDQASNATTSDSAKTQEAKRLTDACKLFTTETLGATLGGTFENGEEQYAPSTATPGSDDFDALKGSACSFNQANDGTTQGMVAALSLAVAINNYRTVDDAKTYMNDLRHPQTAEAKDAVDGVTNVDGVGDEAFFLQLATIDSVTDKTESMDIRFGKQVLVLTATQLKGLDRTAIRSQLTELAKKL